jgi:2-hydroxy-3-oxopropionate reductase
VHFGPSGAGQTVKAANQLIAVGNMQLVAEAIVLLEACGVDITAATRALAGSVVLDRKTPRLR